MSRLLVLGEWNDSATSPTPCSTWQESRHRGRAFSRSTAGVGAGQDVHYQPPAWRPHGRSGYINVSADTSTVVVEGVGASRRQVAHLLDVAIWVQSDFAGAKRRGLRRDMVDHGLDEAAALQNWDDWAAEEVPFLLQDQPWERADVIAATAPVLAHDPQTEVVLAPPLPAAAASDLWPLP